MAIQSQKTLAIRRMVLGFGIFFINVPISMLLPQPLIAIVVTPIALLGIVTFGAAIMFYRCPFCRYTPATEIRVDGAWHKPFFPDVCPKCGKDSSKIERPS
jgi:hypothetical protein